MEKIVSKPLQIFTKDEYEMLECTESFKKDVVVELYVGCGRQEAWIDLDLDNTVKLSKWLIERLREIGEE